MCSGHEPPGATFPNPSRAAVGALLCAVLCCSTAAAQSLRIERLLELERTGMLTG